MTRRIDALDVRLPVVEAEACFLAAAARATDPKDQLVYRLDAKLLHPTAPLSKDDDYPGFAEWVAAREADNRRARKETNR
ncbi:hypothetical protein [Streptomyces sp. JB150]|uniref:hypothetical protein n=1 Tax=Streptomyces sp. JB150 TaxID=2714844 RepID=UPI0014095910|nr:hypothetical protein [Streptomyces sp. JB150]QIJ61461.1 hypothetical protein G7Z13_04970 [Streptomyces sp. JB150]